MRDTFLMKSMCDDDVCPEFSCLSGTSTHVAVFLKGNETFPFGLNICGTLSAAQTVKLKWCHDTRLGRGR